MASTGAAPAPATSSTPIPVTANEFVEQELDERLRKIEKEFGGVHALSLNGPLYAGVDDILRSAIERKCKQTPKSDKLVVVLTTGGGYVDPVQRMVETLRKHYQTVDFVVPNYAYSAGTVFVMSGNAIHMDYYSQLGPIDPQIETPQGRMVSALGQLEKYNELIRKAQRGKISTAEVQLLIEGFDQAELYHYEQARDRSLELVQEWLAKYKFKNREKTRTRGIVVTEKRKKDCASRVGKVLNDTKKWHSHGYGISMDVLERDLNLQIDDYGKLEGRSDAIRRYHDLLSDYMAKRGSKGVVHVPDVYRTYM
jgi:hypothetical protein